MKKQDLDALASLYESVYSSIESGEYLVEGPYDAANVRRALQSQQGRDSLRNIGGYAGLAQAARAGGDTAGAKRYMQKSQQIGDQRRASAARANAEQRSSSAARRQQDITAYQQAFGKKSNSNQTQQSALAGRVTSTTDIAALRRGQEQARQNQLAAASRKTGLGGNTIPAAAPGSATFASTSQKPVVRSVIEKPPSKPPTPAIGKLGNTSFERRTPTSAELRAAQAERATQKASGQDTSSVKNAEKALQAAQRTNLPTTGPSVDLATAKTSIESDKAKANSPAVINRPAPAGTALAAQQAQQKKPMQKQSYEWPSAKTIKDIADAYASIYEAKKKDQDADGDNDFADVRIARMMASGMSRAEAIAAVKNKEYNEEFELDEATRMRKELGKEGEIRVRGELAARSRAYNRSGSVDKTIAAAERGGDRPYVKFKRDEPDADRKKREEEQSRTLRGLAASRKGSVRDKPRAGLRGYAAKVTGSDKDLQTARQRAMSAGTLTPKEKKELGEEYQIYEIVASYLLENNFAETLNDANVIIENMSENWLEEILIEKSGEQPLPYGRMMKKSDELSDSDDREKQKRAATIYLAANAPKGPKVKKRS
jgi:hypothetical protein